MLDFSSLYKAFETIAREFVICIFLFAQKNAKNVGSLQTRRYPMHRMLTLAALIGLGAAPLVLSGTADAKQYRKKSPQTVTACSERGGFDCYTARVISSPVGRKMALRRGTVIDCGPSCRDTLRRETVDFWDTQRENGS
jgi:hypothetical protein